METSLRDSLRHGIAIPAHPLALNANRKLDERRQRALSRYYIASGAGGLAVGVHTTQFAIRRPEVALYKPVLAIAAEEMSRADENRGKPLVRVAGLCGETHQAVAEAVAARELGYHCGLLSLAAVKTLGVAGLIEHCRAVAEVIPLFGFYLQPDVGGCVLSYQFWREFCEIENVAAIKMAPFNRYRTLDVMRAVIESGRDDIALYTGNDDNIVMDLVTPFRFDSASGAPSRRVVGGLLGHWAVWTSKAVELLDRCHAISAELAAIPRDIVLENTAVTDCNAAFFDAANAFHGCIPGIHEVLRRQGLLEGLWCLDPSETLGPGQAAEIDRVYEAYPQLNDDEFVREHLDDWLS